MESGHREEPAQPPNHPTLTFTPIGYVENDFDAPVMPETIVAAESRVVIAPEFVEGLTGSEAGQQVMIVFYFHLVQSYALLQHPRGDRSRPKQGVFALYTPYRPNPIEVTVVDLCQWKGTCCEYGGWMLSTAPLYWTSNWSNLSGK